MGKQQILFAIILYILSLSYVLAGTQYEDILVIIGNPARKKITTSSPSSHSTYSPWKEEGSFNNRGNDRGATYSYSIPAKSLRTSSFAADISSSLISKEIADKLNGKPPKYEITETIKGEKYIPPNKIGVAMYREKKEILTFRHQIQIQEKISGVWKNKGSVTTKTTTVTTVTPEIKIEIRD